MAPADLDKLIKKYLQGKCNDKEKAFIDTWYSSIGKTFSPAEDDILDERKASAIEKRILGTLQTHSSAEHTKPTGNTFRIAPGFWQLSAIAASVLMVMAVGYFLIHDTPVKNTTAEAVTSPAFLSIDNKERTTKRVILPDGSFVELAADSKIRFLNDPASPSRELFLEGEAWFDIAHNSERPFYVYAGDIVTKVLGTSFNVKAFDKNSQVTVTVKTGKVSVYSKNAVHKKIVLTPNQEAVYNRSTTAVATHSVGESKLAELKPQAPEMSFEEAPVSEVFKALGKHYSIEIAFDQNILSGCVLTSTFLEEGFYDRMDIICTAIGATYNVVDARVIISANGCKATKPPGE